MGRLDYFVAWRYRPIINQLPIVVPEVIQFLATHIFKDHIYIRTSEWLIASSGEYT
jgi:hypothetical protein